MYHSNEFRKLNCEALFRRVIEDGGFTVNVKTGEVPVKGYAVAREGFEVTSGDRGHDWAKLIGIYCDLFADELRQSRVHLGGWVCKGVLYLDISEVVETREAAEILAQQRGQLAYFRLDDSTEILTGSEDKLEQARRAIG